MDKSVSPSLPLSKADIREGDTISMETNDGFLTEGETILTLDGFDENLLIDDDEDSVSVAS